MVTRYGYFFNAACQFNTTTIEGFCDPTGPRHLNYAVRDDQHHYLQLDEWRNLHTLLH